MRSGRAGGLLRGGGGGALKGEGGGLASPPRWSLGTNNPRKKIKTQKRQMPWRLEQREGVKRPEGAHISMHMGCRDHVGGGHTGGALTVRRRGRVISTASIFLNLG